MNGLDSSTQSQGHQQDRKVNYYNDMDESPAQWQEAWRAAYRLLEDRITNGHLKRWIEPLEVVGTIEVDGGTQVNLAAVNDFAAEWVRDHHINDLEAVFSQVTGRQCSVSVLAGSGEYQGRHHHETPLIDSPDSLSTALPEKSGHAPAIPTLTESDLSQSLGGSIRDRDTRSSSSNNASRSSSSGSSDRADPRFTFDSFVVGASNQFAHASAVAVAENPGKQYNPLFLYSPPGLGKTHLLHAIGNHLISRNPNCRVFYVSAENFVNELIESLQHHKMPAFRAKFRNSFDVLLIDDIQFIAGKKQTEEEFFHTFNALYSTKRQIILTSDRPPKEIEKLEERIRTRFQSGLVADIQPPEIETRIAILKTKAERDDIYLPDDVATFLATHVRSNVRELEGVLIRLQAQASLSGAEISLEMARSQLREAIPEESSSATADDIQTTVAQHFKIKTTDLKSSVRSKTVALPRQIAMYLTRKYAGLGLKEIGQLFGGKDHTTVMHACKKIEDGIERDYELRESVEAIQNQL